MKTGDDDAAAQAVVALEELRAHPVVDRRRHRRFEVWVAASPEGRDAGKDGRDGLVRIEQLGTQFFVGVGREAARRTGFGSSRHRLALGVESVADAEVPAANELMPVGPDVAEQHIHAGWLDVDVAVDGAGLDRAHRAPLLCHLARSLPAMRDASRVRCQGEMGRRAGSPTFSRTTESGPSGGQGQDRTGDLPLMTLDLVPSGPLTRWPGEGRPGGWDG
jgi:hypothetical protein